MTHTTGNQKSIILMLSITILAVTGTVVNIVSAAGSINVHTNTRQHPVTSTGKAHIVSAAGSINVHTNTRQHPVTSTGKSSVLTCLDSPGTECPTQLNVYVFDPSVETIPAYGFVFFGQLVANTGNGHLYPISGAPIHFSVRYVDDTSHPGHPFTFMWPPPTVKTSGSDDMPGWFHDFYNQYFYACEEPEYGGYNHEAIFTAHFDGGTYNSGTQAILLHRTTSPDTEVPYMDSTNHFHTHMPCPSQHTPLSHPVITNLSHQVIKVIQMFQKIIASSNHIDHSAR
jgi:hypothetical protein